MKKIFLLVFLLAAFLGCATENRPITSQKTESHELKSITFPEKSPSPSVSPSPSTDAYYVDPHPAGKLGAISEVPLANSNVNSELPKPALGKIPIPHGIDFGKAEIKDSTDYKDGHPIIVFILLNDKGLPAGETLEFHNLDESKPGEIEYIVYKNFVQKDKWTAHWWKGDSVYQWYKQRFPVRILPPDPADTAERNSGYIARTDDKVEGITIKMVKFSETSSQISPFFRYGNELSRMIQQMKTGHAEKDLGFEQKLQKLIEDIISYVMESRKSLTVFGAHKQTFAE